MEYTVMNNDGTKTVYSFNSVDSKYIDTYCITGNIKPLYYDVSREVIFYFIFLLSSYLSRTHSRKIKVSEVLRSCSS